MIRIDYYINSVKEFGLLYTFRMRLSRGKKQKEVKLVYDYMLKEMGDIIDKFKQCNHFFIDDGGDLKKRKIMTCWWQGETNMPEILRMCINSIRDSVASYGFELAVIDSSTMNEYVKLPEYIKKKNDEGVISPTHLSDVFRMTLLAESGGVWVDPGHYFLRDGNFDFLNNDFFVRKRTVGIENSSVAKGRWSGNFMVVNRRNILCEFVKECLWKYWEKHNAMIHYFLIDVLINIAYDTIPAVREAVDSVPYTNPNVYYLQDHLKDEWSDDVLKDAIKDTCIFKLTQKIPVDKMVNGKDTVYGHMLKHGL